MSSCPTGRPRSRTARGAKSSSSIIITYSASSLSACSRSAPASPCSRRKGCANPAPNTRCERSSRPRPMPGEAKSTGWSREAFEQIVRDYQKLAVTGDKVAEKPFAPPAQASDQFEAHMLWTSEKPLIAGRPYVFRFHAGDSGGQVTDIKYRVDPGSGAKLAAKTLSRGE